MCFSIMGPAPFISLAPDCVLLVQKSVAEFLWSSQDRPVMQTPTGHCRPGGPLRPEDQTVQAGGGKAILESSAYEIYKTHELAS